MTTELARAKPVSIRRPTDDANPFARFKPLDQHSGARVEMPETPSFTATISAGWKDEKGIPNVSRDGKIHLIDPDKRAPFLAECLAATDFKRLTIAFTSNNPADLVQERFVAYSASSLQLHGDESGITYLDGKGGRRYFAAGTDEFQRAIAKCAVTRSLYFVLAGWDGQRPVMLFDPRDGLTHHRLRFSSRNSLNNIMRQLAEVAAHTNGEIVGLPFELSITYRDVADPTGKRRTVPIWSLVFKPPTGLTLTASSFRQIVTAGLEEGRQLQLPAPPECEAIELAASEYRYLTDDESVDVAAPDPNQLAVMQRGVAVDAAAARRRWFAIARGSIFGTDEGRSDFLSAWTDGSFDSLSAWLKVATQQEVDACLDTLQRSVDCVPPLLPRAWEGLDQSATTPDRDAAIAAGINPVTGEIDEGPAARFLASLRNDFEAATEAGEVQAAHDVLAGMRDMMSPADRELADGWEAAARQRVANLESLEVIEHERQERAEANRATIAASRARPADSDAPPDQEA